MEEFWVMAAIMGLAAIGGIAARVLKQPVILGYIVAGMAIAIWGGDWPHSAQLLEVLGQVGVTLLLFLVGMELPISELKKMGKVALLTGLSQVVISSGLGFFLGRLLGFPAQTAIYLGLGLSFGSTILLVKLLSERGDLQSLPGKIAIGYLLVQDFIAVGVLVMLAGAGNSDSGWAGLLWLVVKAIILVAGSIFISQKLVTPVLKYLGKSTELLFIAAIGWCMVVAALVASPFVGFSIEIGGFLAGLAIASSVEQAQIVARVRPVRDFFLTWFFVALGSQVHVGEAGKILGITLVLCVFVLVINPLSVMFLLGAQGYKKRVAFLASLATTSVSEFSLILAAAAVRVTNASDSLLSVLTLVALVTMTGETYLIKHAKGIYKRLAGFLSFVELRKIKNELSEAEAIKDHVVLFGHNRIGSVIRPILEKIGTVVVVDFNPEVVDRLLALKVRAVYGDMSDHEMYGELGMKYCRLVISTVPDISDSLLMLLEMKSWSKRPMVILTAVDETDAHRLYKAGADYVLVPHSVGGEYVANLLSGESDKLPEKISRFRELHMGRIVSG